jgi:hypothetical protein
MAERGLAVDHVTIWCWVQHYAPLLNQRLRHELRRPNGSWRWMRLILGLPGSGLNRPISAYSSDGLGLRIWVTILVRRLARRHDKAGTAAERDPTALPRLHAFDSRSGWSRFRVKLYRAARRERVPMHYVHRREVSGELNEEPDVGLPEVAPHFAEPAPQRIAAFPRTMESEPEPAPEPPVSVTRVH